LTPDYSFAEFATAGFIVEPKSADDYLLILRSNIFAMPRHLLHVSRFSASVTQLLPHARRRHSRAARP